MVHLPPHIRKQEASGSGYYICAPGASVTQAVHEEMGRGRSTVLPRHPPRSLRPHGEPHRVSWEPWKTCLSLAFSFLSAPHIFSLCLPPCSGENNVMANINISHPAFQNVCCFRYAGQRSSLQKLHPQGLLSQKTNQDKSSDCLSKSLTSLISPSIYWPCI